MEVQEIPKLDSSSSCTSREGLESEEKKMGTQKISVSEHRNAYQYTAEEPDNFVIDMDSFSPHIIHKDAITNSRITRSLSRKGSHQRGGDRKVNGNVTLNDKDTVSSTCSPKGSNTPDKTAVVAVGPTNHSTNTQPHHQITITANNICTTESKTITRRSSFRRSYSRFLDPKRVLLFFATLSSMGTMLLIYFTLTTCKQNVGD